MADPINWPLNPTEGDIYTSPNGDTYYFIKCMWVGSCCPPCIDNICIQFQFAIEDDLITISIPLQPSSYPWPAESWIATTGGNPFLIAVYVDGCWQLWEIPDTSAGAVLCGPSLSGFWTIQGGSSLFDGDLVNIVAACTPCDPLCATIETGAGISSVDMFQTQNIAGDIYYLTPNQTLNVMWDALLGQWVLIDIPTSTVLATLTGVTQDQIPLGSTANWVVSDPSLLSFSTAEGPCACDPEINGITFVGTTVGGITYTPVYTWNGVRYDSVWNPSDQYIEDRGGTWYAVSLTGAGLEDFASAPNPLGPWTPIPVTNPSITLANLDTYCGLAPFAYGCVCEPGGTICYSLFRVTTNAGLTFYSGPSNNIAIIYDEITGTWSIEVSSVEVDVITASSLGPWGTGPNGYSATPNVIACP